MEVTVMEAVKTCAKCGHPEWQHQREGQRHADVDGQCWKTLYKVVRGGMSYRACGCERFEEKTDG